MEGLLIPMRTTSTPRDEPLITISKPSQSAPPQLTTVPSPASLSTLDDILATLRSKPSSETLSQVLNLLVPSTDINSFDISTPSPKASQVVKALLELTVPDFWSIISKSGRSKLISCLRSITGLGGIIARLRFLIKSTDSQPGVKGQIEELLDLLQGILGQNGIVHGIWVSGGVGGDGQRGVVWKEFVTLAAGGKLLSVAAEGENILGKGGRERWVGDGKLYTTWLGREISRASTKIDNEEDEEEWKALAVLLGRGFGLGYSDDLVESLTYYHITLNTLPKLHRLLSQLLSHEKRTYLSSLLRILSRKHLFNPQLFQSLEDPSENPTGPDTFDAQWWKSDAPVVSQIAALLNIILGSDTTYRDLVVDWLVSSNGGGVGEPIGIRRALVAVLNEDQDVLKGLLEKSMIIFGDSVWIRHTPIMRQEVNVQLLLLLSGYAHRHLPQYLHRLARSSPFLNGVSNRLAASSIRARFLGMIVGESLSGLTDKDGKPMDFGVTETASEEARWWKSIVGIQDSVSDAGEVIKLVKGGEIAVRKRKRDAEVKPKIQSKVMVVEEVESEEEEEEDDEFQPYPKPDSDAEDSDEDPTLINRKKDTAPIYIRDLLLYLRSTDSYDRQLLALQSSAALIRRKANFGKELSDHCSELASLLTGLNDKFEMENFQEMRMQALIALVVSSPVLVGGLLARGFFEGDYSLGQRAAMASAIGMGARELAGCDDGDLPLSVESAKGKSAELFPSKMLPGLMHNQWIKGKPNPLDRIAGGMEKMMISPMAAEAADKVTGPNILKVRTFSSRIEVEKRRVKPAENKLGKVVAEAFFFPLTGRWWGALKDFGGRGIHFEPFLLTLFLKTLSIILHATGSSAVALPQMTSELWDLLFSLRNHSFPTSNDSSVQEAVLFALLTLLEVNTSNDNGRRLADEHAKELLETQEWVSGIMESGQLGEEEKGRILAASVIVRIRGIVDAYQRRLMGEMLSLEA